MKINNRKDDAVDLVGVRYGVIGQENVSYIMLVSMSAFLVYEEASAITGCREIPDISSAFKPMGLAYFGIKLGSKGCYATDFIRERYIECPRVIRAVDTTGALPNTQEISNMCGPFPSPTNVRRKAFMILPAYAGMMFSHRAAGFQRDWKRPVP